MISIAERMHGTPKELQQFRGATEGDTVNTDPEQMSMEDLRKAAEAEAAKASTKTEEVDTEEKEVVEEPKTYFSERTIDLGDGAGVQVFKGKGATREEALEDVADKLAEAQKHASAKIRELSKAKKEEPKPLSAADEALLSQELLAHPSVIIEKMLREKYGDPDEVKQAIAEAKNNKILRERKTVADAFVAKHPEFLESEHNVNKMKRLLEINNDFSAEGFEKAYTDLKDSGLLQVKDAEAGDEQKKADAEAKRIADAAEAASSQRTKKGSGISTQRKTTTPAPTEPSEEDMYTMDLMELRKRANQQLAAR